MYAFGLLACQLVVCISHDDAHVVWGGGRWRGLQSDEGWKGRLVDAACRQCPPPLVVLSDLVRRCLGSDSQRPLASALREELSKLRASHKDKPVLKRTRDMVEPVGHPFAVKEAGRRYRSRVDVVSKMSMDPLTSPELSVTCPVVS